MLKFLSTFANQQKNTAYEELTYMSSPTQIPEATRVVWYNTEVFKFVAVEAVKFVITLLIERYS
ncbi:hypothetical protein ACYE2N_01605 [Flavobacterium sp. MAHUQ-51]|uniref:hypothetical protein n=1 Tax=Flavobacterium sp. GCM10022190 TaxID=3252639 RepID=UPI0036119114